MLSHSIPSVAVFGVVLALLYYVAGRDWRSSALVGAVVVSHAVADYATGLKPTWPGGPYIGLQLYRRPRWTLSWKLPLSLSAGLSINAAFQKIAVDRRCLNGCSLVAVASVHGGSQLLAISGRTKVLTDDAVPPREQTLELMHEYTESDSLRKHMLSVEAAMNAYAEKFGEDTHKWATTG